MEEALTHVRKSVEFAPTDVASVNTMALAEYRSGHWAESVAAAERAKQLRNGDSAEDWFILALALWRKGEKDNARMWFDKAARWTKQNAPKNADLLQLGTEASTWWASIVGGLISPATARQQGRANMSESE